MCYGVTHRDCMYADCPGDPLMIYSSDQGRSRQARAEAYPDAESNVIEDDRLNDLFLGTWECEKISTLQETQPEDLALLQSSNSILQLTERNGKGESPIVAAERLNSILTEVGEQYQASEGKIVMFTHPYIVKCYLNKHFPDYEVPLSTNSQILKLTFKNNEFSLVSMEDVAV